MPSLWLLTDSWTESALNGTDPRHTSAAADAADLKRKRNLCVIKQPTVFCGDINKEKKHHILTSTKRDPNQLDRAFANNRHVWLGSSRRPSVSAL